MLFMSGVVTIRTCTHILYGSACFSWRTHTHTHSFYRPLDFVRDYLSEMVPEPIWILLKQETVNGNGISWAVCKSAPRPRQITMPASHHSVFYRPDVLPAAQPTASKHW